MPSTPLEVEPKHKELAVNSAPNSEEMDIARYTEYYFQPVRLRERTAFTMSGETLQLLRNVLQDLGERVPMA